MGEAPRILTERRGSLLFVGLNRPEVRNALDEAMADELTAVLDAAKRAEPCVLVVHSTTPGTFVSGADIGELIERRADDAFRAINAGLFERLEAHRWPTIAAIDGYALGGGCELAMACDLRVASHRSKFGQPEAGLGILAGAGANWRLAQLVGLGAARRLLFTGQIIDAAAAAGLGLVDEVVEPDEVLTAATALAEQIARQSWRALELTKLSLRLHRPATTTFDLAAQALCFEEPDKVERMGAWPSAAPRTRRPDPRSAFGLPGPVAALAARAGGCVGMDSPWSARWAVVTVATAALLLATVGGAIVAAPVTLPLLYRVARRYPARGLRVTAAVVGGLTCAEAAWALSWLAFEEAKPWIWLVPLLAGTGWTAGLLRAGPVWSSQRPAAAPWKR